MSTMPSEDHAQEEVLPVTELEPVVVDLLIIGAGPAGLYGAYYAGFRGLSVAVMDSLPEAGGQVSALYPEKAIRDVAGFPSIKGRELVAALLEQAAPFSPHWLLGHTAALRVYDESTGLTTVTTHRGQQVVAGAVVITGGIGTFTPRPLPGGVGLEPRHDVAYFVPEMAPYTDKDVVVVGGGDSAVDWCLALEPVARSVHLVHRRSVFRAHAATLAEVRASSVTMHVPYTVTALLGEEALESVEITDAKSGDVRTLKCQAVVAALGFTADLGALEQWGLDISERHLVVDTRMATNLPRVYAAGDITEYPGKVRLISVGFGEAATAVNNAAVALDPSADVFPGHSTDAV